MNLPWVERKPWLGRIQVTRVSLPLYMWTWLLRVPCTEVVNKERSHTLMAGGFNFAFDFPSSLCGVPQKYSETYWQMMSLSL